MKNLVKWIVFIITSLIFLYAFSDSYNLQNIDNLDYVIALGVDTIPDSKNLSISFEFANLSSFSENSSSKDTKPIVNTVEAPSISNAINTMNAYLGKQLNLSHCKVIVFSKDFAETGILKQVSVIMHNAQIRPTTNIVVAEDNANLYLKNSVSSLEQVLTKYYDVFPTSSEYTGFTSDIPLGEFYESLLDPHIGTVAILGTKSNVSTKSQQSSENEDSSQDESSSKESGSSEEKSSSESSEKETKPNEDAVGDKKDKITESNSILEGDRGTENVGLAVFRDDKYVGNLSAHDTLWYSLLKGEVDKFLVSIEDPFNKGEQIDITITSLSNVTFNVDVSEDIPKITVKFHLKGKSINDITDASFDEAIDKLNTNLKQYLEDQILKYLYKTSKEFNSDIEDFYRVARKHFLTLQDFENYNWCEKYKDAEFSVEFNDKIVSNVLIEQNKQSF